MGLNVSALTASIRSRPRVAFKLLVLGAALLVRCLFLTLPTGAINTEGAEYARLAENLSSGGGYVGIGTPGTELMMPPLFPALIAALSGLTHSAETAGRILSLLAGSALVIPIFGVADMLYGPYVGAVAAALVAFHPLLMQLSVTVYSEPLYLTLFWAGMYWSFRGVRSLDCARNFWLAGLSFGCAYLTRPDAFIYPFAAAAAILISNRPRLRVATRRCASLLLVFAVCALPYVLFLFAHTSQFLIEGKSSINYAVGLPAVLGESYREAYAVDLDLTERGAWMRSNAAVIRTTRFEPAAVLSFVAFNQTNVAAFAKGVLDGRPFGSPLLFALMVLGLFRDAWRRETVAYQALLATVLAGIALSLLTIVGASTRFHVGALPVMLVWGAKGIADLSSWAGRTVDNFRRRSGPANRRLGLGVGAAAAVAVLVLALLRVGGADFQLRSPDTEPVRTAGLWIKRAMSPEPIRLMDTQTTVAYHAGAQYVPFPLCDVATAIRYIDKKRVNVIVLREAHRLKRPYLGDWIDAGIPNGRARLIYSDRTPSGRLLVYSWRSPGEVPDAGVGPRHRPPTREIRAGLKIFP